MIKNFLQKSKQVNDSIKSFVITLILHVTLLAALLLSFEKNLATPPAVVVLDVALLGKIKKEKKSAIIDHKNFTQKGLKHFHQESELLGNDSEKKVKLIANPLPEIPQDLRDEAFESKAVARFYIAANGEVKNVELIKPCKNPKLNRLLIQSLKKWQFSQNFTESVQDIAVNFKVE
ncbi:MAG: energy transducer TonB [Rickettsiales bacterium]|nr:energy transducer TonB [Rickettsiales bacterium]